MLSFVWAEDENHGIGYQGHLPWHLPADLAHFKKKTLGHPILMGRKTFASLPKILPGRKHLVLTHQAAFKEKYQDNEQVEVFLSKTQLQNYLAEHQDQQIAVIGGQQIFSLLKDQVDLLEKTKIHAKFKVDTYMPEIAYQKFELISESSYDQDDRNLFSYEFLTYRRKEK